MSYNQYRSPHQGMRCPHSSIAASHMMIGQKIIDKDLRKAHQQNNRTVMEAYGIKKGDLAYTSESACVTRLMRLYQKLTQK